MAKFASVALLDGGSDVLRTQAATVSRIKMHLLKNYTAGDSYAVAIGNSLGSVDLVPGDLVQSSASLTRVTTITAKSIAVGVSSGAGPDLHIGILDSSGSVVHLVTDETSNQVVTSGNTFNVPSWTYTANQPV
jgi:hypothetical protein